MARALIVGCGCRGRSLAAALASDGHSVRATTRVASGLAVIEAAGAEAVVADPDRLGTLLPALEGVTVACWLMGTASGDPDAVAAVHGPRLEAFLARLVETPVRGLVYEGVGSVAPELLAGGAALVRAAGERWRMPVAVVEADPSESGAWLAAVRAEVARVLE